MKLNGKSWRRSKKKRVLGLSLPKDDEKITRKRLLIFTRGTKKKKLRESA